MRPTRKLAVYASALAATAVLAGCGGDDSNDASTVDAPEPTASESGSPEPQKAANECVGDGGGSIRVEPDGPTELPGGSAVTMGGSDLQADPPTVSFELAQSTTVEQKNATELRVGDRFGVARAVYVVVRICADEAVLDEF